MEDLSQITIRITLDTIAASYRAGRDALIACIEKADEEANLHAAKLDAGLSNDELIDEETGQSFSETEFLVCRLEATRAMLNRHAQAFALMIHHAWEKHVLSLNWDWTTYKCHQAYGELINDGWAIDKPRLERLRMVSNFIKHEGMEIFEHYGEMFRGEPIFQIGNRCIFEDDALIVSDDDISDFLDAVHQSAGRLRD